MTQPCLVRWNAFAWKNYCFFIAVCGGSFKQRTLKKSRWLDWIFFPWPVQLLWYCVQSCQLQNAMLVKGNRIVYPKRWGARCCLQEKELTASCRTNTIGATQHRLERPAVKGAISMHPAKAATMFFPPNAWFWMFGSNFHRPLSMVQVHLLLVDEFHAHLSTDCCKHGFHHQWRISFA